MHTVRRTLGGVPPDEQGVAADAAAFGRLFEQTYLRFHRRDGKRSELSGASRAVLLHLALSGPLTVGEAARHLDRDRDVLGRDLLERAMAAMTPHERQTLLHALRTLLGADTHQAMKEPS